MATTTKETTKANTTVDVFFLHGSRQLTGRLSYRHDEWAELAGGDGLLPILTIDDHLNNGPWAGKIYKPGELIHGQFASVGELEAATVVFANRLYRGQIEIDGMPLPQARIWPCNVYLQVDPGDITSDQRELIYQACFAERAHFSPGASITERFPVAEIEERTGKKVFRAF